MMKNKNKGAQSKGMVEVMMDAVVGRSLLSRLD
jgi:hypothetical protein